MKKERKGGRGKEEKKKERKGGRRKEGSKQASQF